MLLALNKSVSSNHLKATRAFVSSSHLQLKDEKAAPHSISRESILTCSTASIKEDVSGQDSGLDINEIDGLKGEYEELKVENSKLQSEMLTMKEEIKELRAMVGERDEQLETSKRTCKMYEDHSSLLAFQVYELSERREILEDEVNVREDKMEEMEVKNKEMVVRMEEKHNAEMMKKMIKLEKMEKLVGKVKEENARMKKDNSRMEEDNGRMKEEIARMEEDIARMKDDNSRMEEDNARMKEDNARMKEELVEKDLHNEAREVARAVIVQSLTATFDEDVRECLEENARKEDELEVMKNRIADLKSNIADSCKSYEDQASSLTSQLKEASKKRKHLEDELFLKEEKVNIMQAKINEEIKKVIQEQNEKMIKDVLKIGSLQEENARYRMEQVEMKKQLQEMKVHLDAKQVANDAIVGAMSITYEEEVVGYQNQIHELQRKIEEDDILQSSLAEKGKLLQSKLSNAQRELRDMKGLLSSKVEELLRENTMSHIQFLDEQTEKVNNLNDFKLKLELMMTECGRLKELNTYLEGQKGELQVELNSKEEKVKHLDMQSAILFDRLAAKDMVINQLLQKKPRRRGIRRLFCC